MSNKVPKHQPSLHQRAVDRADAARRAQAAAEARRRRNVWILVAVATTVVVVSIAAAIVISGRGADDDVAAVPSATAQELGCSSCHTVDGARSEGPTWDGLAGSQVPLDDGTTVVADEAYLRRAILEPAAQVRAGFQPSMPTIEVTDAQLDALVAEIRALGDG
jgi:cytochrome c oxidase subunit 2